MMETMLLNKGIGLSAIQVGKPFRILVFDVGYQFGILINPQIMAVGNTCKMKEGCLSLPGKQVEVDRYDQIKVRYHSIEGKPVEKDFSGLAAIVIQHEMDHFEGRLITDYED